jgi:hypothetical protein
MLNSISWQEYFTALCIVLICYYLFVGYKYYRTEVLKFFGITVLEPENNSLFINPAITKTHHNYQQNDATELSYLSDEVNAFLSALNKSTKKEEIQTGLSAIIKKNPSNILLEQREKINRVIRSALEDKSITFFDEDDIEGLWERVS